MRQAWDELWVVLPALDEAGRIGQTLRALAAQTDRDFRLVVVDNGSTDGTAQVVWDFAATAPFPVEVVVEPERGAGTAADTGFRHAIAGGATAMLRTDADCVPAPDVGRLGSDCAAGGGRAGVWPQRGTRRRTAQRARALATSGGDPGPRSTAATGGPTATRGTARPMCCVTATTSPSPPISMRAAAEPSASRFRRARRTSPC